MSESIHAECDARLFWHGRCLTTCIANEQRNEKTYLYAFEKTNTQITRCLESLAVFYETTCFVSDVAGHSGAKVSHSVAHFKL